MSILTKIIAIILAVAVLAFGAAFLTSRYLVSKLDGTGGVSAPADQLYTSEDGITFYYPAHYELSSRTEGNAERRWDVLVLLPKGYTPPQGGEGPPAISMSVFDNIEGYSLEQWIQGDARSNWKLSSDMKLSPTTVGGKPAFAYRHSGLYEADAVAVIHNNKIFLLEAGWMTEQDVIRAEFKQLLSTVQFL